jgi:hypothetical protein
MGTRSTIALEFADGTVEQVYCHWDGYLDYNGRILQDHYSDPFKLRELIDLGDLSSLGINIGSQHPWSPHSDKDSKAAYDNAMAEGACTFYLRDRKEQGCGKKKFKDFADYKANHQYEEFEYILRACGDKAVWFVADHNDIYEPLEPALAKLKVEETA